MHHTTSTSSKFKDKLPTNWSAAFDVHNAEKLKVLELSELPNARRRTRPRGRLRSGFIYSVLTISTLINEIFSEIVLKLNSCLSYQLIKFSFAEAACLQLVTSFRNGGHVCLRDS